MTRICFAGSERPCKAGISACDDRPVVFGLLLCCTPRWSPSSAYHNDDVYDDDDGNDDDDHHEHGMTMKFQVFFLRRLFRQRPNIANMKVST